MALLTKKSIYGLMAIYELYKRKETQELVQLKEISNIANIPQNYLEQILTELKKSNLVNSTRGAKGGYKIANHTKEILIKDVIKVLDGELNTNREKTTSPIFNLFFYDCDKKLDQLFDKPLSHIETYEQMLSKQMNYTI